MVGNVAQSFDVRFDISEVVVLAIELSKEGETSRRRTMEMMPHPIATNRNKDQARQVEGVVVHWSNPLTLK